MIVILDDLTCLKYCRSGSRTFFDRHGLDWWDFVQNGIDADKLLAIDDAMAHMVVESARSRLGASNGRQE